MRNRILVTQTGGWIGDMILLTPALRALKTVYPQSHLALLIRPLVADLMATHPYIDEVIVDSKARGLSRLPLFWKSVSEIRRSDFDLAVVLHPTSFRNALIPFLAGIPERIGSNVSGRGMLLTQTCADRTDLHEIHRYLRVLELIDIHEPNAKLEFWHTDADRHTVRQILTMHGISPKEYLIGVNLGTTWRTKRWSLENFAAVITQIQKRFEARILLTGSTAESPLGEALAQIAKVETINLIGKTTLMQLGALIESCDLYLTCDSGPMHIAAAVGTPTIALFGPTSPMRHGPYGENHKVIEKPVECRPCYKRSCMRKDQPHLCMTEIDPNQVVAQVLKAI
ncbi:lipopolysaccharide heptosyltransferase II [Candidatus Poribacteria bacterium]|nr:MAG: lipopolysaccharide heptosyltransferase II [Candidatus Poribacteria bacterium]